MNYITKYKAKKKGLMQVTEWGLSTDQIRVKSYFKCPHCKTVTQPCPVTEEFIPFHTWLQNEYNRLKKVRKEVYCVTHPDDRHLISLFTTPIQKKEVDNIIKDW